MPKKWELSIVVPLSNNVSRLAHMVIASKHLWCILIPKYLTHYIYQNMGGEFDRALREKVPQKKFFYLLLNTLGWYLNRLALKNTYFLGEAATQPPNTSAKWTKSTSTLDKWIIDQKDPEVSESKKLKCFTHSEKLRSQDFQLLPRRKGMYVP